MSWIFIRRFYKVIKVPVPLAVGCVHIISYPTGAGGGERILAGVRAPGGTTDRRTLVTIHSADLLFTPCPLHNPPSQLNPGKLFGLDCGLILLTAIAITVVGGGDWRLLFYTQRISEDLTFFVKQAFDLFLIFAWNISHVLSQVS